MQGLALAVPFAGGVLLAADQRGSALDGTATETAERTAVVDGKGLVCLGLPPVPDGRLPADYLEAAADEVVADGPHPAAAAAVWAGGALWRAYGPAQGQLPDTASVLAAGPGPDGRVVAVQYFPARQETLELGQDQVFLAGDTEIAQRMLAGYDPAVGFPDGSEAAYAGAGYVLRSVTSTDAERLAATLFTATHVIEDAFVERADGRPLPPATGRRVSVLAVDADGVTAYRLDLDVGRFAEESRRPW